MKTKIIILLCVWLLSSGCRLWTALPVVHRRPQSIAGFRTHCADCVLQGRIVDHDIKALQQTIQDVGKGPYSEKDKKIQARFVVVVDQTGRRVCRLDLFKHPGLVPPFVKTKAHRLAKRRPPLAPRKPASLSDKDHLPYCKGDALSYVKKITKNHKLLDRPLYQQKTGWVSKTLGMVASCAVGIGAAIQTEEARHGAVLESALVGMAGTVSVAASISATDTNKTVDSLKKSFHAASSKDALRQIAQKMAKKKNQLVIALATTMGTACYLRTKSFSMIFYEE